jgi:hypothetical protein
VVAVVMCVKGKPYRFVGQGANLADDESSPGGEIRIDDQHIIFEQDPTVIADCIGVIRHSPLVKIDVRGYQVHFGCLRHTRRNWPGQKLRLRRETKKRRSPC